MLPNALITTIGMTYLPLSAQGVMKALNVNKLTKCGVTFKFWCDSHTSPVHTDFPIGPQIYLERTAVLTIALCAGWQTSLHR